MATEANQRTKPSAQQLRHRYGRAPATRDPRRSHVNLDALPVTFTVSFASNVAQRREVNCVAADNRMRYSDPDQPMSGIATDSDETRTKRMVHQS